MIYEPGFYWVRWDRVDGEWTVGELTNYGWNVVGCNISDLRVGKDIIEVGAAIHRQSHSLPGDVGTVSAVDAFEMGFSFGMAMRGQALEDSRAVGRLLTSDTFKAIAPQIEKATKEQGFDSFQDADSGMCQAKRIIRAALTPSANPKCAMCLGDKVVGGETCSRCGGVGYRTSTPSALSGDAGEGE